MNDARREINQAMRGEGATGTTHGKGALDQLYKKYGLSGTQYSGWGGGTLQAPEYSGILSGQRENLERKISGKILGGGYKGTAEYERQQQAARDRAAAIEQKKAEAEGRRIEGAIMGAYGLDTMEGKKYGLEAEMLGMGTPAYMDYVTTGNPEGIPELGGPGSEYINPYNVYYRDELARNTAGGLPAAQQIQYGQVLAPPWHSQTGGSQAMPGGPIPMGGGQSATQGASMYIHYADALSSYKQEYQARNTPFTIGGYGAPKQSTWAEYERQWGNQGGLAHILGV